MFYYQLKLHNSNKYLLGISFMLLSSAFVAFSSLLGKQLLLSLALPIVMFLRYFLPALILWSSTFISVPHFNMRQIIHHGIRATLGVLSQYALFYYLIHGSILNATLLFMTSPLFVPLISRILFKTPIKTIQWISLIIGFSGVALILKPTHNIFNWAMIIGLISGLLNACSQVYYHKIIREFDIKSSIIYMYTVSAVLTLIPVIIFWNLLMHSLLTIDFHNNHILYLFFILFLISLISICNKTLRGKAYSKVNNASSLTPFLYTAIIFSGFLDWIVYGITPDFLSIIGAILVISSGFILYINKNLQTYIKNILISSKFKKYLRGL